MPTHRIHGKRIQALPLHSLPYFRSRMPTLERSAMPLKNRCSVCSLYLVGNVARFYETKKVFVHKLPWSIFMSEMVTFEFPSRFNIEWPSKKSFLLVIDQKLDANRQTYKPNVSASVFIFQTVHSFPIFRFIFNYIMDMYKKKLT